MNHCECFDAHLSESSLQNVLGDIFCDVDKALLLLGVDCLLDPTRCRGDWITLSLGCTVAELLALVRDAVCSVVDLVGSILGGLLG